MVDKVDIKEMLCLTLAWLTIFLFFVAKSLCYNLPSKFDPQGLTLRSQARDLTNWISGYNYIQQNLGAYAPGPLGKLNLDP